MKIKTSHGLEEVKTDPNGRCYLAYCTELVELIVRNNGMIDNCFDYLIGYCKEHGEDKVLNQDNYSLERYL